MENAYGWAPIVKAEKQADGTLIVTGRVSDDGLDRDKQICDPQWLDRAVPQWFTEGGNVREMHTHLAAGKALAHWKADDGGHMVSARVVDPVSVTKVEHEVLTGFSIGIKNPRVTIDKAAAGGRIVDGQIIEVSLVDRPANPSCLLTVAKADGNGVAAPVEPDAQEFVDLTAEEPEAHTEPVPVVAEAAQDVRAAANEVLAVLSGMGFDVSSVTSIKADGESETSDIEGAQQAIGIIARLIQSEAAGLAAGDQGEACDIDLLLDAVRALRWFMVSEEDEQVDEAVAAVITLSDEPEQAKADAVGDDTPTEGEPVQKNETVETPEVVYLTKAEAEAFIPKADLDKIVEDAVTKATEALTARLAKVEGTPIAGGPVRVRVKAEREAADAADRKALIDLANEYREKADKASDPMVAEGFRRLAAETAEKATR